VASEVITYPILGGLGIRRLVLSPRMIWWDAHVQCAALRRHPLAQLLDHLLVVLWRNVSRMGVDGRQPLVCDWRERGAVLTWQAVEQRVLAGPRRADSTSVGHTVANDRTIPFWRRAPKWLHLGRLLGRFLGHVGSANPCMPLTRS
jgi:hypothetical protein